MSKHAGRSPTDDCEEVLESFIEVIEAAAAGNLDRRMNEDVADEQLRRLAREYNALVEDWTERFQAVDEFGSQVVTATEQVSTRIEDVQEASQDVSRGVDDISEGVGEQTEFIQDIAAEMETLSATIEEIAASADEVVEAADRTAERGQTGRESASDVIDQLHDLEERTDETVENVERLDELMADIEDVASFIDDIAEQTNMLALNANIEAARAGEDGKGFAVVANEVKSLAEETRTATEDIQASIARVREQVETVVTDIHETGKSVSDGVTEVEEALTALDEIVDEVESVHESIQEVSRGTDSQASSTQDVVGMIDEVETISEQTSTQAESVATAAQQQTTSLTEIRTSITTLSERAESLQALLSEVETGTGAVARASEDVPTVSFWHAMSGEKALLLEELAREFEDETDRAVSIDLTSKGSYRDTMTSAIRAGERGNPPAIAQIFEIGTKRAMDSDAFVPVEEHIPPSVVDVDALLDPVVDYYRTDGLLYSMPFNSSNPVLCYNADAFRAAGLDPADPPETFAAVRDAAEQIVTAGVADYGITFANYSWYVEQWFAEQNQQLVNRRNGRDGDATEAYLDSEAAQTVFEWWSGLERDGLYYNPGIEARGEAKTAFHDERAAMLIGSTSSLNGIEQGAAENGFEMRTGYFPVPDERTGVLVGGGSLWLAENVPRAEREAAAEFIGWLANPAQQVRWHRETGYFPVHERAVARLRRDGWFEENPHYATAFEQLQDTRSTVATSGARIGPFDTVRTMVAEAYEELSDGAPLADTLERLTDDVERQLRSYSKNR